MSCSTCVSSLAGFGQDDIVQASPKVLSGIKTGIVSFIGGPMIGSLVGCGAGAFAWKDHRVIGGVLGFFGGGMLGSVVGMWLAKRAIVNDVLPGLEEMGDELVSGGSTVGLGPNSAGPSEWTQPIPLPSGNALPSGLVSALVSQATGAAKDSAVVQATTRAVASITKPLLTVQRVPSLTVQRLPSLASLRTSGFVNLAPKPPLLSDPTGVAASRASVPPLLSDPTGVAASRASVPPLLSDPTGVAPPRSTNLLDYLPGGSSATTSDPSSNRTTLLPGQTMPMLR